MVFQKALPNSLNCLKWQHLFYVYEWITCTHIEQLVYCLYIRWSQKISRRKPVVKISFNSGSIRDEDNKAVHTLSHKWHSESLWNAKVLIKYYQLNLHLSIQLLIKQQVTWDPQQAAECCIDSLSNKKVAEMLQCHPVVDFVKWISKRSRFSRKINFWTCVQQKKKKPPNHCW